MWKAVLLVSLFATSALAQVKVPQRPQIAACASKTFKARGVTVCTQQDALSSVPLVHVGQKHERLDLTSGPDETPGLGWVGLEALKTQPLWVGVLDWQVESPGHELVFVVSTDAGRSWTRMPPLKKPHYLAQFLWLTLESAREWTVVLELEDCAGCGVAMGTYVFGTKDAGKSWVQKSPR